MRLLFAIPHFYNNASKGKYGSSESPPERRIRALAETILSLHQLFGTRKCEIDIAHKAAIQVGSLAHHQLDIVICTTGDQHVLNHLPISPDLYQHHPVQVEPLMLEFECQAVLRDHLGSYDYYCFIEDDMVIQDVLFFEKIRQFNAQTEMVDLLQAHRYEVQSRGPYFKSYVDGDIRPALTEKYQDVRDRTQLELNILGMPIRFRRPYNPHSASFFLNPDQLAYWAEQPHFLDRETSFIGPLESAASLGIMKTFRIYKPDRTNPDFLEIKHADNRFIHQIGTVVSLGKTEPLPV